MRNDGVVARFARQLDGINGFGHTANLVQLDQDGVGYSVVDAARQPFRVGHEQIIANKLNLFL